jgi:hypothetical protein
MSNNYQELLKECLYKSNICHKTEILNFECIKRAHMYCKINALSGPITGPLIEYYIQNKYNLSKINASLCSGDFIYQNKNVELKVSLGGVQHNKFNYVQIRLNHSCDYLLTAYYIHTTNIEHLGELFMFYLSKENIKELLVKYGSYAHGTVVKLGKITQQSLDDPDNNKEYCIRPKYGDNCWNEMLKYRISHITKE